MTARISNAELEVMRILWREGRPLSFGEIRTELEANTDWNKSTIQTLVTRLRDKGVVSTATQYVTLYSANVTEQEYIQAEGQSFIDKLFGGSAKKLAAALCQNGQLSEADIDELKALFQMGGSENERS